MKRIILLVLLFGCSLPASPINAQFAPVPVEQLECAPYQDATASEGRTAAAVVPDRLLGDSTTAIRCLVQVLAKINQRAAPRGGPSAEAMPQLLSATAAIRTLMSRGSQPGDTSPNQAALNDFIKMFRSVDTIDAISALSYGARSDSYDLRLNSVMILGNVIDNTTVCVPLAHLNDPTLLQTPNGINGRANLLGVVSVVAPWAYRENFDNIVRTIDTIKGSINSPDMAKSIALIANIEARLGAQKEKSNKGTRMPPEWRAPCQAYVAGFVPKIEAKQNVNYDAN